MAVIKYILMFHTLRQLVQVMGEEEQCPRAGIVNLVVDQVLHIQMAFRKQQPVKETPRCAERHEGLLSRPTMPIRVAIPNGHPFLGVRNHLLEMAEQGVMGFLHIHDHSNAML